MGEETKPKQDVSCSSSESSTLDVNTVDLDSDDVAYDQDDEIMDETFNPDEAARIIAMVEGSVIEDHGDGNAQLRP